MIAANKERTPVRSKLPAAAYEPDEIDYSHIDPSPILKRSARLRQSRRRRRLAFVSIILTSLLSAGSYFGFVWLPDYREKVAERLRQAKWALEEAQHPLMYRSHIDGYAGEFGVDPALVAAVILRESSYNPRAESYLGARGLMQLMPETAEWVSGKLKVAYDFDNMYDPETNIRFGCWFLGYLSGRFDGDPVKMAAGYHAGAGQVSAWLANPEYSQAGELSVIPFKDTDSYVNKVMSAYDVYKRHYYASPNGDSSGA